MTSPTIQIPLDVALDLPAEVLIRLVDAERLREHLLDMGPAWSAWLLGAERPSEHVERVGLAPSVEAEPAAEAPAPPKKRGRRPKVDEAKAAEEAQLAEDVAAVAAVLTEAPTSITEIAARAGLGDSVEAYTRASTALGALRNEGRAFSRDTHGIAGRAGAIEFASVPCAEVAA